MHLAKRRSRRPTRRQRNHAIMEALEPRVLLSVYLEHDTGNIATNGTNLQSRINSCALGDTIVLDAGAAYLAPSGSFTLPYKSGQGTLTIVSSDIYDDLGHLPAGVRVGAPVAQYMATLLTPGGNAAVIKTVLKDSSGNTVTTGAHDYALLGLEIAPLNANDSIQSLVILGDGTSAQSTIESVAHDITIDRCYVHGLDPVSATVFANYQKGITLNSAYTTISNCEISNIHTQTPDSQAIGGANGTGHFTITNNYLEGSSECFLLGGATTYIDQNVISYITFTNNHLAKRISWNPNDPAFNTTNFGINWNIKNLWEVKNAQYVTLDGNLMDNSWVAGDQVAPAILFTSKNQTTGGINPWVTNANITVTNNVIRYIGEGLQIAANPGTDTGYYGTPAHDIVIRNNLFERVDCRTDGPGYGIICTRGRDPMVNLTIEHNTFYNSQDFMSLGSSAPWDTFITSGFIVRDNVFQYGAAGIQCSAGNNINGLNTLASGITMTNRGVGYTASPTVTFVGGGYTTLGTATASYDSTTKMLKGITITNRGAGYTSVPTIQITGGGATTSATATFAPDAIVGGQLGAWTFTNNLIFGAGTPSPALPSGNIIPSGASGTMDAVFIRDPAGERHDLLSASPGHNAASDGTDCGVNVANLAAEFVPLDASLTGYWKFDEGTGTSVSDSSGNGKTGTLSSSSLWTASGQSYNAVALTGGTSGSMSASSFTTAGTFSFAAWVKPGTITANSYVASAGNSAFSMYVNSTGKLVATTSNGATVTDSTALTAGTWYMVGCTYDGATKKLTLYKNGVSVGNNTTTGTIATGSTTLYLGGNGGSSSSFNGSIDEARYYNTDMSTLTFNAVTGMKQLYDNFGALLTAIYPGNPGITTTTSTFSTGNAIAHYTYVGVTATLVYTWTQVGGPAGVTFDANNGTTAGKSCVATWPHAGVYRIQLDVTGPDGSRTTYGGHPINVNQVPTSVSVSPSSWSLAPGATKQFTNVNSGLDQWGDSLTGSWTWAVASGGAGGTIDATTGLYYAPAAAGADIVNLKYNGTVVTTTSTDANVTVTGSTIASVTVSATDASAGELWSNNGTYTFTRTGSTASALTVNYTMSGAATNGTDYSTLGPTVVIPAGSASQAVTLTPIDDTLIEGAESAVLTVTSGTGYARGSAYSASVSIADSGDIPTVTISATTASAYEAGPASGVFTVTRSGPGPALTASTLAVVYNISGTGTNTGDYATLTNSVLILPGETSATITVAPVDDTIMESTETVILTLASVSTYTVGSPSVGTVSIVDNDTTPTVTISATTPGASETGPTNGVFTVTRNGSTSGAMTVNYSISGSASNTSDYSTLAGNVVIPTGSASATVTISTINDTLIEGSETAVLTVTTGTGYVIGSPSVGTVTIADNDVPSATISATTPSASEQGPVNGVFTVTRNGSGPALLTGALTVNYSISGTASNSTDYSTLGTTVVIPNGTASATITVAVIDDTVYESTETAILTVTTGTGYTVGSPSIGTVNIADNDMTVSVSATDASAAEDGASGPDAGVYTFTRVGSTSGALTVNYTMSGTAATGTDYTAPSGSVVIPSGSASATVTLTPIRDDEPESTETAVLTITSGTGYGIGSPSVGTVNIADNGIIAYEGFNYSTGSGSPGPIEGANGGYGFSNAWDVVQANASSSINSGSLSYDYNSHALKSSGNAGTIWWPSGYADATRTISDSGWGASGTSRWFSFMMSQHNLGVNGIYSYATLDGQLRIATRGAQGYSGDAYINGTHYYVPGTGATCGTQDLTVFVVVRIDFGDTSTVPDKVYMWANNQGGTNDSLTPGTIPSDAVAAVKTITLPDYLARGSSISMNLQASQGNVAATYDEIRLGSTYYSVGPDPILTGHEKKAPTGLPAAAALKQASAQKAAAFLDMDAAEQLLSGVGVPVAGTLTGPMAKAAAASSGRSTAKAFRMPAPVAQGDSPFDSLSASALSGIKL